MKRVLLLAESPYTGGITSHILSICDAFAGNRRYEILLATLPGRGGDGALYEGAGARGLEAYTLPMHSRFDRAVGGQLLQFVEAHGVDLVHTHNYRATIATEWASLPVPSLNTCHGAMTHPTPKLRFWQALELRVMRGRPVVVACSYSVRDWLVSRKIDASRIRVVHNGFGPPAGCCPATREQMDVPPGDLLLLFAGRLVEGKGLHTVLEAMESMVGITIVVAGDGPLRVDLETQAKSLRVSARFLGAISAPWPYYAAADVVVLPSHMEALPMSLIEAAAFGKPAVATRVGGIPEVVIDGETGLLVAPGDITGLRESLGRLRDPDLRLRLGEAALARWRDRFSRERLATELGRVYDELLP